MNCIAATDERGFQSTEGGRGFILNERNERGGGIVVYYYPKYFPFFAAWRIGKCIVPIAIAIKYVRPTTCLFKGMLLCFTACCKVFLELITYIIVLLYYKHVASRNLKISLMVICALQLV